MNNFEIKTPVADTCKTTKQEKYEKMAKYAANKARREQKEKERIENDKKHDEDVFNHNLNILMDCFLGRDEEEFLNSYIHIFGSLNIKILKSENNLLDAYPDKVKAVFNEKKELVERYAKVYSMLFLREMNSSGKKRDFYRNTECLVYDIMWLNVCEDNKELLGPIGYDELKTKVDYELLVYLEHIKNPEYRKNSLAKVIFEWIDKTYGYNLCERLEKTTAA